MNRQLTQKSAQIIVRGNIRKNLLGRLKEIESRGPTHPERKRLPGLQRQLKGIDAEREEFVAELAEGD